MNVLIGQMGLRAGGEPLQERIAHAFHVRPCMGGFTVRILP